MDLRDGNGLLMGGNVARIWVVLAWGIAGSLGVTHAVICRGRVHGTAVRLEDLGIDGPGGLRCGESLWRGGGWLSMWGQYSGAVCL